MCGLSKTAISVLPIADFIADFQCVEKIGNEVWHYDQLVADSAHIDKNQSLQLGRIGRKRAGIWPTIQNRQSTIADFQKAALPMAGLFDKN